MSTTFSIGQGDTLPVLNAELTDDDGNYVPLDGATVLFRMIRLDQSVGFESAASIVDADAGQVRYTWSDGDTDTAGIYRCEFVVTDANGVSTVPNSGCITVIVREKWSVPS